MKKIALLIMLTTSLLIAQNNNKGRISLLFDGEKIDLPLKYVTLHKDDNVKISARGESNIDDLVQQISLEFALTNLGSREVMAEYTGIQINIKRGEYIRNSFSVRGNNADFSSARERFSYVNVPTRFSIDQVRYEEGELKITGSFEGTYTIDEGKTKSASKTEIKEGRFEIII